MMIPGKTPDYSKYTLEDLYDVSRRINRVAYAERYALVLKEIELRHSLEESGEVPPIEKISFWQWFFGTPANGERSVGQIIGWWEKRRWVYMGFVFFLNLAEFFALLLVIGSFGMEEEAGDFYDFMAFVGVPIAAGIAYTFGWILDLLLYFPLRRFGWRVTRILFRCGMAFSLFGLTAPVGYWLVRGIVKTLAH